MENNGWISTEERFPEKGESVLIWRTFPKHSLRTGTMTMGALGFDGIKLVLKRLESPLQTGWRDECSQAITGEEAMPNLRD